MAYLYYKSIKDTPVCGHLDFNCLKLKYEVFKLSVWMSDPYLYYNSIKDPHVCGHLDFNCLKLKYGGNHDILLFILAPGYTASTWGCVVLTVYDRHRCQTQVNFSPFKKFTLVLLDPELTLVLLIPFLKTLDPISWLLSEAILSGSTLFSILIENTDLS